MCALRRGCHRTEKGRRRCPPRWKFAVWALCVSNRERTTYGRLQAALSSELEQGSYERRFRPPTGRNYLSTRRRALVSGVHGSDWILCLGGTETGPDRADASDTLPPRAG